MTFKSPWWRHHPISRVVAAALVPEPRWIEAVPTGADRSDAHHENLTGKAPTGDGHFQPNVHRVQRVQGIHCTEESRGVAAAPHRMHRARRRSQGGLVCDPQMLPGSHRARYLGFRPSRHFRSDPPSLPPSGSPACSARADSRKVTLAWGTRVALASSNSTDQPNAAGVVPPTGSPFHAPALSTDWRLLLPNRPTGGFDHLVLIGADAALSAPERIVRLGIARRVDDHLPPDRPVDAIVALPDARRSLSATEFRLLPGGALYWEVEQRSGGWLGLARARRALRDAGLTMATTYLIQLTPGHGRVYLPLEHPAALRWYLRTLYVAGTPRQRLRAAALRPLAGRGHRLIPFLTRSYAVTAVAGPARDCGVSILASPELPPALRRPGTRIVLLGLGTNEYRRQVLFAFAPGATLPLAVLKVARIPAGNEFVEREHVALEAVGRCLPDSLRQSVPEPIGLLHAEGLAVSVQSYVPGRPLAVSSGRWGASWRQKLADVRDTSSWLAEFHRVTELHRVPWDAGALSRWVAAPLDAYTEVFGASAQEERLFAAVRERAQVLLGMQVPVVWQHGSFDPPNITRDGRRINIVDWEHAAPGLPLLDLIHFATRWGDAARGLRTAEARARALCGVFCRLEPEERVAVATREAVAQYMRRLDLDSRFLPAAVVLTCVTDALRGFERSAGSQDTARNRREALPYVTSLLSSIDMLAKHVEALFAHGGR
jgi:aminoglycoside phosphotransferase (APT) family kinase protein